jgi:Tfp pilus assembly protein PilW
MHRKKKGLSLIEIVMSMAAFTIILTGTIQIVAQSAKNFRAMKLLQANLETAQFALNTMAKELRTSSVVSSATGATSSSVTFFDYSQSRCIQYRTDESTGLVERRAHAFGSTDPDANRTSCAGYAFAEAYESLLTGLTEQAMDVVASRNLADGAGPMVGRVTVSLTVGTGGAAATVQTTVSLRDFNFIGI